MADPDLLPEQPDTNLVVQSYHAIAKEFAKLPNVPALAEGNAIRISITQLTTQIQQLAAQMQQGFTQTNQRFDQIDNKIDSLATRVIANDHNSMARVQNSYLSTSTQRLIPLVNPTTNTPITGFPIKPQDISAMDNQALTSTLQELGLPLDGGKDAKEKRFRQHIGLRPKPQEGA